MNVKQNAYLKMNSIDRKYRSALSVNTLTVWYAAILLNAGRCNNLENRGTREVLAVSPSLHYRNFRYFDRIPKLDFKMVYCVSFAAP